MAGLCFMPQAHQHTDLGLIQPPVDLPEAAFANVKTAMRDIWLVAECSTGQGTYETRADRRGLLPGIV